MTVKSLPAAFQPHSVHKIPGIPRNNAKRWRKMEIEQLSIRSQTIQNAKTVEKVLQWADMFCNTNYYHY